MIACIIIKWVFSPKFLLCLWICTCVFVIKEKYILLCHRFVFCPVVHLAHTVVFCFHFLTFSKYIFLAFLIFCRMLSIRRSLFLYLSFLPLLHRSFILSLSRSHMPYTSRHILTPLLLQTIAHYHISHSPSIMMSPPCPRHPQHVATSLAGQAGPSSYNCCNPDSSRPQVHESFPQRKM